MAYYATNVAVLLGIITALGLSFNLLMGYSGLFSIAHAAFFGIGAYTVGILMTDFEMSYLVASVAAVSIAGVISLALGMPTKRVADEYLVILTLAFQILAIEFVRNLDITGGSTGLLGIPRASIFGFAFDTPFRLILLAWGVCFVIAVVVRVLVQSPFGRVLESVREDEVAARSLGKRTQSAKIVVFAMSCSLAALSGTVFAGYLRFISPAEFGLERSIEVISIVIIGGLAAYWGPFIGAAILVLVPQVLSFLELPNTLVGAINGVIFSLLLILFLIFRPQGIIGTTRVVRAEENSVGNTGSLSEGEHSESTVVAATPSWLFADVGADAGGLLRSQSVSIAFGGVQAVDTVSFSLPLGQITGLVGPNGAGKTTLFNLLSGHLSPDEGRVYYGDQDVTKLSLEQRADLGVVRSFQDMRLFAGMTVESNLLSALTPSNDERASAALLGFSQRHEPKRREQAHELLAYLGLGGHAQTLAGDLSYAEQKLLMIGRLLATNASIFLLDEPMAGLDKAGRTRILRLLDDAVERGATICLVEHSLEVIRQACTRVAFLADGRLLKEGPTEEITQDEELVVAYFGS